ncbi:hypothetical protein QQY24_12430 [Streptomyces sp. TG1A-8]|uniref:hypothetical protein n=1 Tax=Streptomyces sp. TG1A-8 TaxID=3051385 RepID=UPI00265C691F|nr:hypothetical protein [Streptomyces sp. TG1A-8]MDO0926193.1 hypothetical protein [Streptomyces sp. TG1A-8]
MAGTSAGIVAGLTALAVGVVGLLAHQAHTTVPAGLRGAARAAGAVKAPRDRHDPAALPDRSGTGERVVYSVDDDRVWLVGPDNRVGRTFPVRPGGVDPLPGTYWVSSRSNAVTGSDGAPVEHVVRFTSMNGVAIGFSAAVGSAPAPASDADTRTGGIRESREDGEAMWRFATIGVPVVVIR